MVTNTHSTFSGFIVILKESLSKPQEKPYYFTIDFFRKMSKVLFYGETEQL